MNFFIVFLLPSVLGIKTFTHLSKIKDYYNIFAYYLLLVLFSNYFSMLFLSVVYKLEINLVEYASVNYIFCVKYMTLSMVANVVLSIIFTILKKSLVFYIEVENGKGNKKEK